MNTPFSVTDIMGTPVVVKESNTFCDVLRTMFTEKTNSVLVVNEEGVLAGEIHVVSLYEIVVPDYLEEDSVAAHFASEKIFKEDLERVKDVPARDFMVKGQKSVTKSASLMQCAVIAIERGQARIPVVDEHNRPIGTITRRGLKKILALHAGLSDVIDS